MTYEDLMDAAVKYPDGVAPPFRTLMERIGFEGVFGLAEEFGGGAVYVPIRLNMFRECRIKAVLNEYNGLNHRELAKKYDFTENGVKKFLRGEL